MSDNVVKMPGLATTPEECLEFLQRIVSEGKITALSITAAVKDDTDDTDVVYFIGSGTRSELYWLINAARSNLEDRWM